MARPIKQGLDYFTFDVGFFDDIRIKELRGKYGKEGENLFIYLLCLIYEKGFYITLDDGYMYVLSADRGVSVNYIGQVINFLCKRSLFNAGLFASDKVLTSHGIQMRYQEGVAARAQKRDIEVDGRFWILKKEETKSYIKVIHFSERLQKNPDNLKKNPDNLTEKTDKVKESKVKQSKVNNSICADKPHRTRFVKPTVEEIALYCQERGNNINAEHFFDYYESKGWTVGKQPMKDWKAAVRNWERNGYSATCSKNEQVGKGNYDQRQYNDELLDSFVNRGIDE